MISLVIDEIVLKHTAFVTLALVLKFQVTNLLLGASRIKSGSRPPEDTKLFTRAGPQDFDGTSKRTEREKQNKADGGDERALNRIHKAKSAEVRAARLVMNDVENIPLGLIVAWMAVLCGGNQYVHVGSLWAFCLGRYAHSYAYFHAIQPMRAICFMVGLVATFVLAGNAVFAVTSF